MREIADRVGLSQAGLLHHFGSKEELLAAVLDHRDVLDTQLHLRLAAGDRYLDALRGIAEHNARVPGLIQLFVTLSAEATDPEHPAHDYFVHRYARVRADITAQFRASQAAGRFRPDLDAAIAATLVIAVMDGLQVQWLLNRELDVPSTLDHFLAFYRAPEPAGHRDRRLPSSAPEPVDPGQDTLCGGHGAANPAGTAQLSPGAV